MRHAKLDYPFIVADIGGTNARFGLVTSINKVTQKFVINKQKTYSSAEFTGIDEAVRCYQESINGVSVSGACLAVAGPVAGDKIKLTNLNWNISVSSSKKALGLNKLNIINDFSAYAYAIQFLEPDHLRVINQGIAIQNAPLVVVGPGTGFGVASIVNHNQFLSVIPSEGGHMSLAANTALQSAIKEHLSRQYSMVSIERIFSGSGLRRLYHALADVEGAESQRLATSSITQRALDGSDALCQRTLALFCSWLGSVTGDIALALGAQGGVFLSGGILPRIADFLIESDFQQSFKAKDQMKHYLKNIPIQLISKGNSALLGAAACYCHS